MLKHKAHQNTISIKPEPSKNLNLNYKNVSEY